MTGNNHTDRSKLGTKRHILTDKKGIPLSAVISSASTHDIKLVTNVVDNIVIKQRRPSSYMNLNQEEEKTAAAPVSWQGIQFWTWGTGTNQTGVCIAYALQEKERGSGWWTKNKSGTTSQKTFSQAMGCGENKLLAQQVSKTVHTIWKEGWELSWVGTVLLLYNHLQKYNFGIGSKFPVVMGF